MKKKPLSRNKSNGTFPKETRATWKKIATLVVEVKPELVIFKIIFNFYKEADILNHRNSYELIIKVTKVHVKS